MTEEPVPSKRLLEILTLMGQGYTREDVGERLFLSPRTVDWHLKEGLTKFNAKNRLHLYVIVREAAITFQPVSVTIESKHKEPEPAKHECFGCDATEDLRYTHFMGTNNPIPCCAVCRQRLKDIRWEAITKKWEERKQRRSNIG